MRASAVMLLELQHAEFTARVPEALRADPDLAITPVVVLTTSTDDQDRSSLQFQRGATC